MKSEKSGSTVPPFEIKDCAIIPLSTGLRSHNLLDFRDRIAEAPLISIYHHFYEGLLRPSFDDPVYTNDFAVWADHGLRDSPLAEKLGGINPMHFSSLEDLRQELLEIIEDRLAESEIIPWSRRGSEFYFLSSKVVIFDTKLRLKKPSDLKTVMRKLAPGSLYFHFIEAQRRDPIGCDDFSNWLKDWGPDYHQVCQAFQAIDYHFFGIKEIRSQLLQIVSALKTAEANGENR